MKAYELRELIGPEGLTLNSQRPEPQPSAGEVLIRVRAASLNYRDISVSFGRYPGTIKTSVIPLSDGAGEIVRVGPGVPETRLGERVVTAFYPYWIAGAISETVTDPALGGSLDGVLAELITLPASAAIPIPEHLSFEEAATLPSAALTAWQAIVEVGKVRAGDVVLTLGTGGVSLFALQLAKLHNATVIVTSGSQAKLERVRALGADHVLNYRTTPEWDTEVLQLTQGRGVDVIVEVGGPGTLERSLRCVRKGGTIVFIGRLAGTCLIDPLPIMRRAVRVIGINVGSHEMFAAMNRALAASRLRPVIDRSFDFSEARAAYDYFQSGVAFGKVVITV
ncbi:MAG: NAD(P)-dependent alcohol dehydrogenase [Gammaproteobacteria bacterium]|nr:NAD(P)-dependent alcohol dehydrogenase [Gammaproteobacteria bacterium]